MIRIVRAKVQDAKKIRQLENAVWGEEVVNKYDEPMLVRFGWFFVAKEKGKLIGAICSYKTKDNEVYVCDWVVTNAYRGKDVGLRLYKKLILAVKGLPIITFIDPKNTASLSAHKKLGFRVVRIVKNPYDLKIGLESSNRILVRLRNNAS